MPHREGAAQSSRGGAKSSASQALCGSLGWLFHHERLERSLPAFAFKSIERPHSQTPGERIRILLGPLLRLPPSRDPAADSGRARDLDLEGGTPLCSGPRRQEWDSASGWPGQPARGRSLSLHRLSRCERYGRALGHRREPCLSSPRKQAGTATLKMQQSPVQNCK